MKYKNGHPPFLDGAAHHPRQLLTMSEKSPQNQVVDTASMTSQTMTEKASAKESGFSTRDDTRSPSPTRSVLSKDETDPQIEKVATSGDARSEITRIQTREDGAEYPTGIKLVLVTVALCLAVFLMALDNTIIATGQYLFNINSNFLERQDFSGYFLEQFPDTGKHLARYYIKKN